MPLERMWKVVQLEKYFDFSLYSHHFSLLSLTSLLSTPEREVTSPSDFKVVGALMVTRSYIWWDDNYDALIIMNQQAEFDFYSALYHSIIPSCLLAVSHFIYRHNITEILLKVVLNTINNFYLFHVLCRRHYKENQKVNM
jgi:hypothetical protein